VPAQTTFVGATCTTTQQQYWLQRPPLSHNPCSKDYFWAHLKVEIGPPLLFFLFLRNKLLIPLRVFDYFFRGI